MLITGKFDKEAKKLITEQECQDKQLCVVQENAPKFIQVMGTQVIVHKEKVKSMAGKLSKEAKRSMNEPEYRDKQRRVLRKGSKIYTGDGAQVRVHEGEVN